MEKTECDQEKPEENFDPRNNVGTYLIRIDALKLDNKKLRAELEETKSAWWADADERSRLRVELEAARNHLTQCGAPIHTGMGPGGMYYACHKCELHWMSDGPDERIGD